MTRPLVFTLSFVSQHDASRTRQRIGIMGGIFGRNVYPTLSHWSSCPENQFSHGQVYSKILRCLKSLKCPKSLEEDVVYHLNGVRLLDHSSHENIGLGVYSSMDFILILTCLHPIKNLYTARKKFLTGCERRI